MTNEERKLLIAKFWCDVFLAAFIEPDINPIKSANSAVEEFSRRFPEENTGKYNCAICGKRTDHDTYHCPGLLKAKSNDQVLGGISGMAGSL